MGRNCIWSLVEKFDDKLIPSSLAYFEKLLENATDEETIGVCNALYQMVDASRTYSIHHFISRVKKIIGSLMTHDEKQVWEISMKTLRSLQTVLNSETLYEEFFKEFVMPRLHSYLYHEDAESVSFLLENLENSVRILISI